MPVVPFIWLHSSLNRGCLKITVLDWMYKTCTVLCGPFKECPREILTVCVTIPHITSIKGNCPATCDMPFQWHPEGQLGKSYQCAGYLRMARLWSFSTCHVWGSILTTKRAGHGLCLKELRTQQGRPRHQLATDHCPAINAKDQPQLCWGSSHVKGYTLQIWKHFTSVIIPFIQLKKLRCRVAKWLPQHHTTDRGIAWALTPGFLTLRALFGFHPQFYFSVTKWDSFFYSPATDHLKGSCLSSLLENSQFSKLKI